MEQRHTPGPWIALATEEGHEIRMGTSLSSPGFYDSHHLIEYEHGCYNGDQVDEAEANAKLIAAAPDQYEAHSINLGDLEMLTKAIDAGDPKAELLLRVKDLTDRTCAAIKKATE